MKPEWKSDAEEPLENEFKKECEDHDITTVSKQQPVLFRATPVLLRTFMSQKFIDQFANSVLFGINNFKGKFCV